MFFFHSQLLQLGGFLLFSFFLGFILIYLSYFFSTYNPDSEKTSAYECGFDPYEDTRDTFDVRFYLVAILFIIFDLEALYFYPWTVSLSFLTIDAFWGVLDFILELFIGFFYVWKIGVLNWE